MPPQLEKNHVVPTSWQDEALARDGMSREVPCSALKGETLPDSLPATPKSPPTRRGPPRGTQLLKNQSFNSPFINYLIYLINVVIKMKNNSQVLLKGKEQTL